MEIQIEFIIKIFEAVQLQCFPFEKQTVQCKSLSQILTVLNKLVFVYLTFLRNLFFT